MYFTGRMKTIALLSSACALLTVTCVSFNSVPRALSRYCEPRIKRQRKRAPSPTSQTSERSFLVQTTTVCNNYMSLSEKSLSLLPVPSRLNIGQTRELRLAPHHVLHVTSYYTIPSHYTLSFSISSVSCTLHRLDLSHNNHYSIPIECNHTCKLDHITKIN